jgi:tetratricopeptide (TPR) repeat protein
VQGLTFGSVSLKDIRNKLGNNGFYFKGMRFSEIDEYLITFNCYELSDESETIAIFVTKLPLSTDTDGLQPSDISALVTLDGFILATRDYLESIWGKEKSFDPKYKKVPWSDIKNLTINTGTLRDKASLTSSDLLAQAAKCSDFDGCFNVMLQSANPRNSESINLAVARIAEFQKPRRGNRKVARELNTKGLAEFKKDNFEEAVILWFQASSEDPGDVEVLTNFGLGLYKANRALEARRVLLGSLAINPRRTNTWVPMAEVLFEIGDSDSAFASLLLAYEFSGDKRKTRSFFDERAVSSERVASLYLRVLEKVNE